MKNPTMLFRSGDSQTIWGVKMDTVVVDESEIAKYSADGWVAHPHQVKYSEAVEESDTAAPRRGRPPKIRD